MKRFFVALVCAAMVFLGSAYAYAAEWSCTVIGERYVRGPRSEGLSWQAKSMLINVDIKSKDAAREYAVSQWEATFERNPKNRRHVYAACFPISKQAKKTGAVCFTCRVAVRWVAVFGTTIKRGLYADTKVGVSSFNNDRADARKIATDLVSNDLKTRDLRGSSSTTITFAAGECWRDDKPSTPSGWPGSLPW